jgi:hypothetical protein
LPVRAAAKRLNYAAWRASCDGAPAPQCPEGFLVHLSFG